MKRFYIPVTWSVWDKVAITANSIEEAVEYVKNNIDDIPLGTEPEYIDDSYKIEDGQDGSATIEETVAYLKDYWNLSDGIFGEEIDEEKDSAVLIDKLCRLVTELDARECSNNLVCEEYRNIGWDELCESGIKLLKHLKEYSES